jgi:hypothetical protein
VNGHSQDGRATANAFQQLKDEGSDQALFGLERIVRQHPRDTFEVQSKVAD